MKPFGEYISDGIVWEITPDDNRAKNLFLEARRKLTLLDKNTKALGITDENANDYVEYCYNVLMFYIRGKLFENGFMCSGQGAHEAEVAFTEKLGLTSTQIAFLDELRYFRNGILYYGKRFDSSYATIVIDFTKKVFLILDKNTL